MKIKYLLFNIFNKSVPVFIFLLITNVLFGNLTLQNPVEIMNRVDENQHLVSAWIKSEMIIQVRRRQITKKMESYIQTEDKLSNSLTEFLNPRDRGTKYLKLGDNMWMYFPDAEDLVHISGHMLREGMMGSDFSYEDILESEKLSELYVFELQGKDKLNDRNVFVINATAREDQNPSYHTRKIWVDSERFVVLQEHLFSTGGRLLKVLETKDVKKIGTRWFPVEQVMNDKLRANTNTTFRILEIKLDIEIPKGKISLESLQ